MAMSVAATVIMAVTIGHGGAARQRCEQNQGRNPYRLE
jgi:hypothetical protein